MTNGSTDMSMEEAVQFAFMYARTHDLGESLEVHEAYYLKALREDQRLEMEERLGRPMSVDEMELFEMHNSSGWVVQLVFEKCADGDTPQGPKILINDDGVVRHFRPM